MAYIEWGQFYLMKITQSFEGQIIPTIQIVVRGPVTSFGDHKFEAGIDTGFTGFLSLPFLDAVKPGLILRGVIPLTLADGQSQSFIYCLGEVQIESKSQIGIVVISPSNDVLVGMEFLRQFNLKLIVDSTTKQVILTDEEPPIQPQAALSD